MRVKCGRGLAPDGGVSVTVFYLAHRYREQAPSHSGMCFFQMFLYGPLTICSVLPCAGEG